MQHPHHFSATHWSVILAAGSSKSPQAQQALETLCGRYWYPLYAFLRREGLNSHDAQDLTQDFLTHFLDKDYLADVDRGRGKFRSFLLAALRHFLANHWDKVRAQKCGGGQPVFSLDFGSAEN